MFHAQQTVGKSLKAVLCIQGKPVPLSHDVSDLLARLAPGTPPGGSALADLTPFATIRRYEEGVDVIPPEEIQGVLELVETVIEWAKARVSVGAPRRPFGEAQSLLTK